ncbi:hypothetical protein K435DRAFT_52860 [Dendrothele bispora CBS 962.96]|uniref:Crinkler effector protein N-terminal domain-containing protein n=1 Tax=Dendrothele bispora (strain CBS 962.96) TaxID=1314807 RepID=A0A4S8KRZ4_DENBC|nr:hypothetical protein K435DRAFT_52860 [Dendrothele bispora CBS 962.96]
MTDQPTTSVDYSSQEINRPPSPPLVTLSCCVVGSKTPFSLDISSSLTVGHLKQTIQQNRPNLLKGIDAADLELFKVSVLEEDDIAKNVEDVIEVAEPLDPTTEIIEIFPDDPPKKTIHIAVVRGPTAHQTVANSNVSGDSGRSTSTLLPGDSASQASSRETPALSSFVRNNVGFETYLTATQCVYDLDHLPSDQDPMSENTKQIKQILGDLPEKPSSSDFSLLYVAQRWELYVIFAAPLSMLNKEQEQALQHETVELYRTWELSQFYPDLEVVRERLKPAALMTARPQIVDVASWLPTPGPTVYLEVFKMLLCTDSPRLQHGADTMTIVYLTLPWGTISQEWQPGIAERHLRIPLDTLYMTIFGYGGLCPGSLYAANSPSGIQLPWSITLYQFLPRVGLIRVRESTLSLTNTQPTHS